MATTNDKRKRKLSYSGTTNSVPSDCKKELDPIIFFPTREMFLQSMVKQQFSLPYPIMKYIWENPSSAKVYQKLVQSCKMFFIKNPLIVVSRLESSHWKGKWQTNVDCASKMLWPSKELFATGYYVPCPLYRALEKIVKCDIYYLSLSCLTCTSTELSFIGSKCTSVSLSRVSVIDENGVVAPLENFFGIFKKIEVFYSTYSPSHLITSNTVSELIKMENFSTVDKFIIDRVPELFDINTFYDHFKTVDRKQWVELSFTSNLSAPYEKRLQEILNEIRDFGGQDIQYFKMEFDGMAAEDLLRFYNSISINA